MEQSSYDVYGYATILNADFEQQDSSSVGNIYYFTGRQLDFETGSALSERLGHAALRIGSTIYHVPGLLELDIESNMEKYTVRTHIP